MENVSVLEAGFPLDDLRVEELEPRLEFAYPACPVGGCCEETGWIIWGDETGSGAVPPGCPGAV